MLQPQHAAEIAARYHLGADASLVGPVGRGETGRVWRLDTDGGTWAVKEGFEPLSAVEAGHDAAYQDAVRAAGVPMPAVLRTPGDEVVIDLHGSGVRVYEWVDLLQPDRTLDPAAVGMVLANIHRVEHRGVTPADPWYSAPVGAPAWDGLVEELISARAPFATRVAELRDELVALEALLEVPTDLRTCHRDLFADNILPTPEGSMCVIDWEESGLANPSQETAMVLFDFCSGDAARARSFYEAYAGAGGPGRIEAPKDFSMVIAVLGHLTERALRLWLDPSPADMPTHTDARVEECITYPLTRDGIVLLLDAIH